jgi:hypothetical protein
MGNITNDLKKIIFASKIGDCPSIKEWQGFYKGSNNNLPVKHLTSCSNCLDIVNHLHSIPMLNERNPFDTIERDGGDGNSTPFNSSSNTSSNSAQMDSSLLLKKLEENRQKQFEYIPQEITFCVNGWPFTSCKVEEGVNRFTLRPKLDDELESLELLDEKGSLLCHILLSENLEQDKNPQTKQNLDISPNQKVSFSVLWLEDFIEINLEYTDKRFLTKQLKENNYFSSFSNFLNEVQNFFSPKMLVLASIFLTVIAGSLIITQIFWQRKFNYLEQELVRIQREKQSVEERLTKAETSNQTLEKDLTRIEKQLKETPLVKPINTPTVELPKIDLVSKLKIALAVASQNTITNLIYNTRAVVTPILLQRGNQSVFGVRLPRYEENSQQEFSSYIVKFNLPKEKPFVQQVKLPVNSADPTFVSIEIKLYNTNNIAANTLAEALVIGVIGNQEIKIATIPIKFE